MRKYLRNNSGLTLVEILAALVILSIVLVAFMSFFTQSAKFTAHNYEKLTAVQIAEDIVSIVRTDEEPDIEEPDIENICIQMKSKIDGAKKSDDFKQVELNKDLVTVQDNCEEFDIKVTLSKKLINLGKANILVKSASGKGINEPEFETEMYFEVGP